MATHTTAALSASSSPSPPPSTLMRPASSLALQSSSPPHVHDHGHDSTHGALDSNPSADMQDDPMDWEQDQEASGHHSEQHRWVCVFGAQADNVVTTNVFFPVNLVCYSICGRLWRNATNVVIVPIRPILSILFNTAAMVRTDSKGNATRLSELGVSSVPHLIDQIESAACERNSAVVLDGFDVTYFAVASKWVESYFAVASERDAVEDATATMLCPPDFLPVDPDSSAQQLVLCSFSDLVIALYLSEISLRDIAPESVALYRQLLKPAQSDIYSHASNEFPRRIPYILVPPSASQQPQPSTPPHPKTHFVAFDNMDTFPGLPAAVGSTTLLAHTEFNLHLSPQPDAPTTPLHAASPPSNALPIFHPTTAPIKLSADLGFCPPLPDTPPRQAARNGEHSSPRSSPHAPWLDMILDDGAEPVRLSIDDDVSPHSKSFNNRPALTLDISSESSALSQLLLDDPSPAEHSVTHASPQNPLESRSPPPTNPQIHSSINDDPLAQQFHAEHHSPARPMLKVPHTLAAPDHNPQFPPKVSSPSTLFGDRDILAPSSVSPPHQSARHALHHPPPPTPLSARSNLPRAPADSALDAPSRHQQPLDHPTPAPRPKTRSRAPSPRSKPHADVAAVERRMTRLRASQVSSLPNESLPDMHQPLVQRTPPKTTKLPQRIDYREESTPPDADAFLSQESFPLAHDIALDDKEDIAHCWEHGYPPEFVDCGKPRECVNEWMKALELHLRCIRCDRASVQAGKPFGDQQGSITYTAARFGEKPVRVKCSLFRKWWEGDRSVEDCPHGADWKKAHDIGFEEMFWYLWVTWRALKNGKI